MTSTQLKAWRSKNLYSQNQLAKVLGVATMTVSRWERGVREIPSFLHLALECLESRGGEIKKKGKRKRIKRKEVKK
jgi:transcriptional regulator with XRE-family HTH domain